MDFGHLPIVGYVKELGISVTCSVSTFPNRLAVQIHLSVVVVVVVLVQHDVCACV